MTAATAATGPKHRRSRSSFLDQWATYVFLGLLVVGLVIRVLSLRATWGQPDSDVAVGQILADRAAHGHFSLLFWGGDYGGAIVSYPEALLIRIFGLHFWIFFVVDTAITLGCALFLRAIASHIVRPLTSAVVAGVFSFFPPMWLYWTDREYIFWMPAILFALAFAWIVVRSEGRPGPWWAAVGGLFLGVAIWSYPLCAPLAIPAILVFLWRSRRLWRDLLLAAGGVIVGVLPWLAWFAIHGLHAQRQADYQSRWRAAHSTVGSVLPTALAGGEKRAGLLWDVTMPDQHTQHVIGVLVYAAAVVGLVGFLIARRWALASVAGAVVLWAPILVVGHIMLSAATFRYALIIIAPLLLLVGWVLERARVAYLLAVAAIAVSIGVVGHDTNSFAAAPTCDPGLIAVADHLAGQHRTDVWGSYWLSYDLTVCSGGRVTAASTDGARDHHAVLAAGAAPRSTYVAFTQNQISGQIASYVKAHPGSAVRQAVGGYDVWTFQGRVSPQQMDLQGAT